MFVANPILIEEELLLAKKSKKFLLCFFVFSEKLLSQWATMLSSHSKSLRGWLMSQKSSVILIMGVSLVTMASVGYNILQQAEIKRLAAIKEITSQKEGLVYDSFNEILMGRMSDLRENIAEVSRNQGRVEGMTSVAMNLPPDQNLTSALWHEGYYRGMSQTELVEEMAYVKGYHQATEDMNCPADFKLKAQQAAEAAYKKEKEKYKEAREIAEKEYKDAKKQVDLEKKVDEAIGKTPKPPEKK
jgi:hypothetical protein